MWAHLGRTLPPTSKQDLGFPFRAQVLETRQPTSREAPPLHPPRCLGVRCLNLARLGRGGLRSTIMEALQPKRHLRGGPETLNLTTPVAAGVDTPLPQPIVTGSSLVQVPGQIVKPLPPLWQELLIFLKGPTGTKPIPCSKRSALEYCGSLLGSQSR